MKLQHYWDVRPRQRGFSLVEILVGITVGLMLTAGVIQIFANNKQGYRIQTALSRLQENGRFAINFISRDVRNSGFFGCGGNATRLTNTLNNASQYAWDFSAAAQGFEATSDTAWSPVLSTSITNAVPLGDRDIITLRHATGNPARVVQQPGGKPPVAATVHVTLTDNLDTGDIVMVADCTDATIFQITNSNQNATDPHILNLVHQTGTGTPGNATTALGKDYTDSGSVTRITTSTYFIRADSEGRPALYRLEETNNVDELIKGVEDMQILYGEDTDGNRKVNLYATANQVTDWSNVISVRITLLLQSLEDNLAPSPQSYTFNGVATTPGDRRLRRVFTAIINFRNRSL